MEEKRFSGGLRRSIKIFSFFSFSCFCKWIKELRTYTPVSRPESSSSARRVVWFCRWWWRTPAFPAPPPLWPACGCSPASCGEAADKQIQRQVFVSGPEKTGMNSTQTNTHGNVQEVQKKNIKINPAWNNSSKTGMVMQSKCFREIAHVALLNITLCLGA